MATRHVVLFPYPVPGHYIPLSTFAHALASCDAGIRVTIVHTEANLQKLKQQQQQGKGNVEMLGISDGLPLPFDRTTQFETFFCSIQQMAPTLQRLLQQLHAIHPISCLVSDPNFPWVHDVASYLALPLFLFVTDSAAAFTVSLHARRLLSHGFIGKGSLKDTNAVVDFIPGIPALPARALPFPEPEYSEFFFQLRVAMLDRVGEVAGVLLNTFHELERGALDGASSHLSKPLLAVGPCVPEFMIGQYVDQEGEGEWVVLQSWLDGHAPASVMYVCFGSLVVPEEEQIREIWEGLRASKQPFLWSIRSTVAKDLEREMRRGGSQQGMVVGWAPQQQVLRHASVGGFMTHCGWNSVLEALSAGVPMLCCPQFLDQLLTCFFIVQVWRVGLQLGDACQPVQRGALESHVRSILLQEEGKVLKEQASQLHELARGALQHSPPGSSIQSLHSFIKLLKDLHS